MGGAGQAQGIAGMMEVPQGAERSAQVTRSSHFGTVVMIQLNQNRDGNSQWKGAIPSLSPCAS